MDPVSAIVEEFAASGVKLIASLPDDWFTPLIARVATDERFTHVAVNREESAIGLCSGAFFSGTPAVALMGASGLMTCIYALTKINYTYMIPMLLCITLRGAIGDPRQYQVSNGLYLQPVLQAIDLPYTIVERNEQISMITKSLAQMRVMARPIVVAFTESLLRGN